MGELTHIGAAPIVGRFEPGSPAWHELRLSGVGGSEVAAVLGLSTLDGPHTVWMRKMGILHDDAENIRMRVGSRLEPLVIDLLRERGSVAAHPFAVTLRHPEHQWWVLNIDGVTYPSIGGEQTVDEVVEAKTSSERAQSYWLEQGVPLYYQTQCQYILGATGLDSVIVPCLFGNGAFEWWRVRRDEEDIAAITSAVSEFWWNHVVPGVPPPIDGSSFARDYLTEKYGWDDDGAVIDLDEDADHWVVQYERAQRLARKAEQLKAEAQNHLLEAVGTASAGVTPRGHRIRAVRARHFDEAHAEMLFGDELDDFRTQLDTQQLRRERPDIYEASKTKINLYPRVTAPKN